MEEKENGRIYKKNKRWAKRKQQVIYTAVKKKGRPKQKFEKENLKEKEIKTKSKNNSINTFSSVSLFELGLSKWEYYKFSNQINQQSSSIEENL